jgi:general secretion pathway protein J
MIRAGRFTGFDARRRSSSARGWPPRTACAMRWTVFSAKHPRAAGQALRASSSARGFTLLELTIALVLLALMSAMMFGSLSFAGRSWDGGEAKATQVNEMRQTEEFLRAQLGSQYPLRIKKVGEFPLQFVGEHDELRFAAALPSRVAEGGVYFFRLAVVREDDKSRLVQYRVIPDPAATAPPDFHDASRSVLADGIAELRISYFGRDAGAVATDAPTWRDRWDDPQQLPMLVRIEVMPEKGPPWPQLVVEPRPAPEAGCRSWDTRRERCAGI